MPAISESCQIWHCWNQPIFRASAASAPLDIAISYAMCCLSERSQFLNKLSTLEEIVDELGDEFIESTRQLAKGISADALQLWALLDLDHYDLTTCLRETDVLLKSFLCVLPEDHLGRFDFTVCGLARARRPLSCEGSHDPIRPRRMVAVAGE